MEQAIFDFLKKHLRLHLDTGMNSYGSPTITVDITLLNPATNKHESIDTDSTVIDLDEVLSNYVRK